MVAYEYNFQRKAWTKICSMCKVEVAGTDDEKESYAIFALPKEN